MSTQDTSHNATNPDPTPRTAATAREALIEKCADAVWNAGHYTFGADLDDLIALAAAEAPGRVSVEVCEGCGHEWKASSHEAPRIACCPDCTHTRPASTTSEPVERCVRGVYAVHAGIPTVVTCGEPHDAETHEQGAPDYDHPFTPATRDE